jgi:hypothetical protein
MNVRAALSGQRSLVWQTQVKGTDMYAMLDAKLVAMLALIAALDRVPTFNVEPACRYLADRAASLDDMKLCLSHEHAAREQLAQEWAAFALEDRAHCARLATVGDPSYADLLTCLELARETRAKHDDIRTPTTESPQK